MMITSLQRIQHLLSAVEYGQVLLADPMMEEVVSEVRSDIPNLLAALQLAGRFLGALRATSPSQTATQAEDPEDIAQALEISLQKLGLGDPARLPEAIDPMFTFDVTLVAAITVSAPDEKLAREKIAAALAASRAILGNWPDGSPILATVRTDAWGLDIGPCCNYHRGAAEPLASTSTREVDNG